MSELHIIRVSLMRILYFLTFITLVTWWPRLFSHDGTWDPLTGVGISFYAVASILALVGIAYPIQMIPLLLIQLLYKATWVLFVGLPITSSGAESAFAEELMIANSVGVVIDLLVIPWFFVFKKYFGLPKLKP
ncbi:hypothetical protein [Halioxenophilus aromaticivorans]|uniref:Uncharacterized protein n=1 Tax=Halioxenophilus aromaticivorans TaxID=1306992 RepID=A0AAV3TX20_9ALTE